MTKHGAQSAGTSPCASACVYRKWRIGASAAPSRVTQRAARQHERQSVLIANERSRRPVSHAAGRVMAPALRPLIPSRVLLSPAEPCTGHTPCTTHTACQHSHHRRSSHLEHEAWRVSLSVVPVPSDLCSRARSPLSVPGTIPHRWWYWYVIDCHGVGGEEEGGSAEELLNSDGTDDPSA